MRVRVGLDELEEADRRRLRLDGALDLLLLLRGRLVLLALLRARDLCVCVYIYVGM